MSLLEATHRRVGLGMGGPQRVAVGLFVDFGQVEVAVAGELGRQLGRPSRLDMRPSALAASTF